MQSIKSGQDQGTIQDGRGHDVTIVQYHQITDEYGLFYAMATIPYKADVFY
jgi:hypothetical protein